MKALHRESDSSVMVGWVLVYLTIVVVLVVFVLSIF